MPLYEYRCPKGHKLTAVRPMRESAEPELCALHGCMAERIISPVRVFGDYPGYVSPASGKWVEGKKARTEDLARTNCRPYEDGEREMAKVSAAAAERALDNEVEEIVEQELAQINL